MRRKYLVLSMYLLAMLAGVVLSKAFGFDAAGMLSAMRNTMLATMHAHAAAAAGFVLMLSLSVFLSVPANPLFYLLGGYCFGVVEGTLLSAVSATLGATAAYRFFNTSLPGSGNLQHLRMTNAFGTLVLLRVSPWFPAPLITLICSVMAVPSRTFFLTTLLGSAPLIFVYALVASRFSGPLNASVLYSNDLLLACGALGVLSMAAFLEPIRLARQLLRDTSGRRRDPAPFTTQKPRGVHVIDRA